MMNIGGSLALGAGHRKTVAPPEQEVSAAAPAAATWRALPLAARLYVAGVIAVGASVLVTSLPHTYPQPVLFVVLTVFSCLTSAWKVTLPISVANGSTLSVSYAANLMALLLLGPQHAIVISVAGVWIQCAYKAKQHYPLHRTVFSMATAAITMAATGRVYGWFDGPTALSDLLALAKPLVASIATYFLVNTSLVAGAIAFSTSRTFLSTWRKDFLWSGASFMFAGSAGALAAIVVSRGDHWKAVLLVAPIYLTYRTYELFVGRLEDQNRHTEEIQRLHQETIDALRQTREAERALSGEKERLALALAEMTRLEEQQKHLLEREQSARASAEEANRLKDQFLAMVSHELRTPLNAILGWADMLRRGKLPLEMRERACQTIYDSAKRQAQLIEDLLDVARITSGKLRLERRIVDLRDAVHDALQVIQPGAEAKRIRVTLDADSHIAVVFGDASRLQQIVWNLLSNAVKFTPEGGSVHVGLHRMGTTAELTVTDSGEGISPDFLSSVFKPFRQQDESTTRAHAGIGLGLSIVKNLVEAHGGTVSVDSAGKGRGATFTVRMPSAAVFDRRDPRVANRILTSSEPGEPMDSLEGLSVLVVDDDHQSRDVVAAHLQSCKAAVKTAASAADAFDLLLREHVDVLLADIGMPGEDGYGLIRRVRAVRETASIPAAALTAFAREEDRQLAIQAGFQLHLAKPIEGRTLITAVAMLGRMTLESPAV